MKVEVTPYQVKAGQEYCEIRLTNNAGMTVVLLNYGATLERVLVPTAAGTQENVVMSLPTAADYDKDRNFLGGTVGRIIGRMAKGRWQVGDHVRQFGLNDGPNHAHGGPRGFDTQVFTFTVQQTATSAAVVMTLLDPAGHAGYPGNLLVTVTYTFDETSTLRYQIAAVTDAMTLCNPGNHTYFRLSGPTQSVRGDRLQLAAVSYLPLDAASIPTGQRAPVAGTAFDFRSLKPLADALTSDDPQIVAEHGLNHPFMLSGQAPAAVLESADGTRRVTMTTDAPAIVVYTANHFNHTGVASTLGQYDGVALEAQVPPSPDPRLAAITLLPGQRFERNVSWQFQY